MKDISKPSDLLFPSRMRRLRLFRRRTIVGTMGAAAGLTGAAYAVYRAAPNMWRNFYSELGRPIADAPHTPNPSVWPDHGLHAAWIGHSTVLLKIDGFTILTDPIFSSYAGVHMGMVSVGVKRTIHAALEPEDLPEIDLILLSHAHMDHMDVPSLRALENKKTAVVTARHTSDLLRVHRYRSVQEVGWGETVQVGPVKIQGTEVKHWGARMRVDTYRGYNGYVIDTGGRSVVFAGDTANTTSFRQLRRSRPHDLVVMPIGAYNPWEMYHCTPEQAWAMAEDAGFTQIMPVHHQTFPLSSEPLHEPIERLLEAARGDLDRVAVTAIGQEIHVGQNVPDMDHAPRKAEEKNNTPS